MRTLAEVEQLTKIYSESYEKLSDRVRIMNDEIEDIKKRHLPKLKSLISETKNDEANLRIAIEESPSLFTKPRTLTLHGIKIGFQKGRGKIEWQSDEQVVKLISKHFPEQYDVLVQVIEKPVKKALEQLNVNELKKLGITVVETTDQIVVKATDSEIEKFINQLLKESTDETQNFIKGVA